MNDQHEVAGSGRMQRFNSSYYMYDTKGNEVDCLPVFIYESGESWTLPHSGLQRTELIRINVVTGERWRVIP